MLFCYYLTTDSRGRLLRQDHRQTGEVESCRFVPWMNVSSSATSKEEIYYLYDLSINTTVISLDDAKSHVKSTLLDQISFTDKYSCCSSEGYTNQDSSSASYSSSDSPGTLAFAISSDEVDLEDTSGMPCNPNSVTDADDNKCTPIVGNVFLIAANAKNNNSNSTSDNKATLTFKQDIMEAIQYTMDHDQINQSPYMNVTYIGTRNTTNDGFGSSGGGWAYIPILNNAKDCFLTQVNGVITTVQNKTPGVLNTVEQQAVTLGPMGVASIVMASSLFLFALLGCWCKHCSKNRKGITDNTSTNLNTTINKLSADTNHNNAAGVELVSEPYTPKTESSTGSTTTTTLRNFSIVESNSEDDIEIALATVPTTTTVSTKNENITYTPIYDEASGMLTVALLTYAYASLRKYAAKTPGKYKGESAILKNEPVKAVLVYGFVKDNIDILKTEEEFQGEDGLFALKQLLLLISSIDGANSATNNGELVVFNDKNPKQICYGITLNRVDKRIVVSFRGTQSLFDIIHDIKISYQKVTNPLYGQTKNQKRYFRNHQGFYHCFFQDKEEEKTKLQIIMDQLLSVLKENPDYKVYMTGHSLGGALATLFTFFASTPQYLGNYTPYPFTCVSIASPSVGNDEWRRAFMLQEKMGRIRHLRVTNYGDIVPKVPQLSLDFFPIKYCHVGIHLQLYDNTTYRFSYPVDGKSASIDVTENIIVPLTHSQILHLHGCDTYHSRIDKTKDQLQDVYLEEMYTSKEFVGSYSNV